MTVNSLESILDASKEGKVFSTDTVKMDRRSFLRLGVLSLGASLVGCREETYNLVYGFSENTDDLRGLQFMIGDTLNARSSLHVLPTHDPVHHDHVLLHDVRRPKIKVLELAVTYLSILQQAGYLGPSLRPQDIILESDSFDEPPSNNPVPQRNNPTFIRESAPALLSERKRHVFRLITRAIDQHQREGMAITQDYAPLIMSLVQKESNFGAELRSVRNGTFGTISRAGAVGYMQLMPFNVPQGQPAIQKRPGEQNSVYARRLIDYAHGRSLEELAHEDVRFDPYQGVYYGIRELMGYLHGSFRPGTHTYRSYSGAGGILGTERPIGHATDSFTLTIAEGDNLAYSLVAYNAGGPRAMGLIVRHKKSNSTAWLDALSAGSSFEQDRARYAKDIMGWIGGYRAAIPSLR